MGYPTNNNENYNHEKFCKDFELFSELLCENFQIDLCESFRERFCEIAECHTPKFILTNNIYDCFEMLLEDMYYIFWYQFTYGALKSETKSLQCGEWKSFMEGYVKAVDLSKSDKLKAMKFKYFDEVLSGKI